MRDKQTLDQLKSKLEDLGYGPSSIRADVRTKYGRTADLVAFKGKSPWVVFELKASPQLELPLQPEEAEFHPTVRQAQSLAQELGAPYFAVFDGNTISWFDIDKKDGRPRFLQTPIVHFVRQQEQEGPEVSKDAILHVLFSLTDLGRQFFDLQESITHAGMAVLARFMLEAGDKRLETFLLDFSPDTPLFDNALADLATAQDKRSKDFYPEAFGLLDNVQLSEVRKDYLIDALDQLLELAVDRRAMLPFKLPGWLSELMARLAAPNPDDVSLDIYSNFGDGLAAISKIESDPRVFSMTSSVNSYLWDRIKRVVLGRSPSDVVRVNAFGDYADQQHEYKDQLDRILVAPPFGVRLKQEGFSGKSEEFFLRLSLDWVRPGGRVVAIVPEGLLFSSSQERTRCHVMQAAWVRSIIGLEQFMPGTSIRASILVLDRKSIDNREGRVMMCRILDQDVRDFSHSRDSILSNERMKKILEIHDAHLQDEALPEESGVWFVSPEALDIESWTISYYAPERELELDTPFDVLPLKKLARLRKGSPLTLDQNGPLLVIGPGALRTLSIDPAKLDRTTQARLTKRPVRAETDDILIHAVGPNRGQAALVEPDFEGMFVSRNIIVVRSASPLILPAFLAIALNSRFVQEQLKERATGSVIPQLTIGEFEDVLIPLPDLETQRAIVKEVSETRQQLAQIEQQLLTAESTLKEQQHNLRTILNNIHLGGGQDA